MNPKKSFLKSKPTATFEEQDFRLMFEGHSVPMLLTEPQTGNILFANQAAVKFYGYPRSKLCGMSYNEINTSSQDQLAAESQKALDEKRDYFILPHRLASGEERLVEIHSSLMELKEKKVLFSIIHDITERRWAERTMNFELYLMRALMDNSPAHIYFKDRESRFIKITNAQAQLFGLSDPEQAIGKTDFDYFTDEHAQQAFDDEQEIIRTGQPIIKEEKETRHNRPDTWISTSKLPLRDKDGNTIGTFGVSVDITERKQAEAELRQTKDALAAANRELQKSFVREQHLAHMDDLTGINNHRSLLKLAEHELNSAQRYQLPLSMMFLDVDHFKKINDTFGHNMGDQALKKIIQIVCGELRSADEIGRYGGDEFVILLPQTGAQEALFLAERIHSSIAKFNIDTDKGPLSLTISIGIAETIQPDLVQNLLLRADQALYVAKQKGRNCTVIFDQK
jgi:diguanylate cyclase (GGDEF)-like protein/PAS domain S-box-containing protein